MSIVEVKIKRIGNTGHDLPEYLTGGCSGMDLRAVGGAVLEPGERALVETGIAVAIPEGYEGQIRPRSGVARKEGLTVLNSPGTIDSDYRGEVKVLVVNLGQREIDICDGDRIAQLVICPVVQAHLVEVEELDDTDRGSGGFGSTGR
jgi:dUTP pyrophosphatase